MHNLERANLALSQQSFYSELGDEWKVKRELQEQLEDCTCVMYSQAHETSVNLVRSKMLKKIVEDKTLSSKLSRLCSPGPLPRLTHPPHPVGEL